MGHGSAKIGDQVGRTVSDALKKLFTSLQMRSGSGVDQTADSLGGGLKPFGSGLSAKELSCSSGEIERSGKSISDRFNPQFAHLSFEGGTGIDSAFDEARCSIGRSLNSTGKTGPMFCSLGRLNGLGLGLKPVGQGGAQLADA